MKNGVIAIIDSEADYALKLAEYFNLKSGLQYSVSVFTDYQSLQNYLSENVVDILLISEDYAPYVNGITNAGNIFILTEGNVDAALSEYHSLYKYQASDCILRDVMSCYASYHSSGQTLITSTVPAKIIGVYSPVKRCGKTCFALSYGCIDALSETCLYLNFEEYPGFFFFSEENGVGDLSDLLYFYRQNPGNLDKKLMALSKSYHNLSYIPPMQFSYDIKNLEGEDLAGFIQAIARSLRFQTLVLDLSDSLKDVPSVLKICDKIYMPTIDDAVSEHKITHFFENARAICKDEIEKKCEVLKLPYPEESLFSPEYRDSGNSSVFLEKLLCSSFGAYVNRLLTPRKEFPLGEEL